jgi:hypothetical protein
MPNPPHIPETLPSVRPKAGDRQTGAQVERFGQRSGGGWRVFELGVTTTTTVPGSVTAHRCQVFSQHRRIQWLVLKPPGTTDYNITIGRWIASDARQATKGVELGLFVADEVQSTVTGDLQAYQRNERDPVGLFITAINGAPTGPPRDGSAQEPTRPNRTDTTTLPDGFVILVRGADAE